MNNLVQTFGNKKIWVNYRLKKVEGRMTKVPYNPHNRRLASSTNPDHWGTYVEALGVSQDIGIVFDQDKRLLGVDLDHCLEGANIVGDNAMEIVEFLIEANTYTEVSPSGTGLHCYFIVDEPLDLETNKDSKKGYEAYTSERYFTVTQNIYQEYDTIRTITKVEALGLLVMLGYPWNKKPVGVPLPVVVKTGIILDDEVVEMMFNAQNGIAVKKLFNGDTSEYNGDDSSADMALCSHLAFWTGKDAEQMDRIWLRSPLGKRDKTIKRKSYRYMTIKKAIENCKDVYGSILADDTGVDYGFLVKKKQITLCTENILRLMRKHPSFMKKFRYDYFKQLLEIEIDKKWLPFEDKHIIKIQTLVASTFVEFQQVTKATIYDCIVDIAHDNGIDSAADYVQSQVWDKVPRLDTWLCDTYGVENDEYHRAVGSNWLKGLVKRIIIPGCKFDYVLVVEGPQGTMKSTSLAVLGRDWHMETTASTESKDFFMSFEGKAIIEFSEGETLSRTEVKRLKAIITTQVDKFRAPYDRISRDHPRRCVFAMTTNSSEYLKDETGNRRWLPIAMVLPKANVEWLEENRDQLFAEAYDRVITNKETIYEFPELETIKQQTERRIEDPNSELICDWYDNTLSDYQKEQGVSITQVYIGAFKKEYDASMTKLQQMSIANVLREDLKLKKRRIETKGRKKNIWFPKEIQGPLDTGDRPSIFKNDIDLENLIEE